MTADELKALVGRDVEFTGKLVLFSKTYRFMWESNPAALKVL